MMEESGILRITPPSPKLLETVRMSIGGNSVVVIISNVGLGSCRRDWLILNIYLGVVDAKSGI